jgi:hypothetical protein
MRYRSTLLALALAGVGVVSSCSLVSQLGGRNSIEPIAIPTSTATPSTDEIVFAMLQDDGACLFVTTIKGNNQGPSILPIWPKGFTAKIGPRARELYSGPGQEKNALAVASELMELHGEYVDTAPADAVVPPECAKYPLFLVGRVFNRS